MHTITESQFKLKQTKTLAKSLVIAALAVGCGSPAATAEQQCSGITTPIQAEGPPRSDRFFQCGSVLTEELCAQKITVPDKNFDPININGYSFALDQTGYPPTSSALAGPFKFVVYGYDYRNLDEYPAVEARVPGDTFAITAYFDALLPGSSSDIGSGAYSAYGYFPTKSSDGKYAIDFPPETTGTDDAFSVSISSIDTTNGSITITAASASCADLQAGPKYCPLASSAPFISSDPKPELFFDDLEIIFDPSSSVYEVVNQNKTVASELPQRDGPNQFSQNGISYKVIISDPSPADGAEVNSIADLIGRTVSVYYGCLKGNGS